MLFSEAVADQLPPPFGRRYGLLNPLFETWRTTYTKILKTINTHLKNNRKRTPVVLNDRTVTMVVCQYRTLFFEWTMANILSVRNGQ